MVSKRTESIKMSTRVRTGSQNRQTESHGPILEGDEVEASVYEPSPDKDVGHDPRRKVV